VTSTLDSTPTLEVRTLPLQEGTETPTIQPPVVSLTATIAARMTATAEARRALTPSPTPTPDATRQPALSADELLDRRISQIINRMSVAERVGQLLVVEFQGSDAGPQSDIAELIQDFHVGGVVLRPQNENFSNSDPNAPREIATLANQLQALAHGITLTGEQALNPPPLLIDRPDALSFSLLQQQSPPLPLLIGAEQMGDGIPTSALRAGFTGLPSQMALGATWNPGLVEQVGRLVGEELAAVGINLLIGPNLDVLEQPRPNLVGGLGIHMFGGDSFWVGEMGRAYVTGVHTGGQGQVATIARHFPGQGGTDRHPHEEVATVQKSLNELRRTDLLPFDRVTQQASSILRLDGDPGSTDGLMSSHIRYSGLQGTRERTPPISLAQDLNTILGLSEFTNWRQNGGVMMSDALGVPSIRRYYDPTLSEFPRRRVALDAFLAGNDLLFLSGFDVGGDWAISKTHVREIATFFQERYTSDPEFASRVDRSLRRILRLKLRLYDKEDTSSATAILPTPPTRSAILVKSDDLRNLASPARGDLRAVPAQVAREAVTILHPDPQSLADPLPPAPQSDERLLIFSDSRLVRECDRCPAEQAIAPRSLEEAMLRLYGPSATGQLRPEQLTSLSFAQLSAVLNENASPGDVINVEALINQADWLLFLMLDVDVENYPSSDVVKQFLRQQGDRLRGKRVIVLALNAPYFLDATEISKLTAYLGLYSKDQPFIDAAVHTLFRAAPALGHAPVSVSGTRYSNLLDRLEPDPDQSIRLLLLNGALESAQSVSGGDGSQSIQADLAVGDVVEVGTGVIVDRNGNPVPDGTLVNFRLIYEGQELALPVDPVPTRGGVARIQVPLERADTLRISASSVGAVLSTIVLVSTGSDAGIAFVNPELPAAVAPSPQPDALPDQTPSTVQTAPPAFIPADVGQAVEPVQGQAAPETLPRPVISRVDPVTLALALVTQLVALALLLIVLVRVMPRGMLVYRLLWALVVGWLFYIFYGLGIIPGSAWLQMTLYPWGVIPVVFIGMLLPLVWLQLRME
jgi:beta-N-acetylhexosaminidase